MGLFPEEEKKGSGYKGGSDKNLSDIHSYVLPLLKKAGFECLKDKSDGTSNKQRIYFGKDKNNYLLTQIIVVETLHNIDSRANSNISEEMVDKTTEEERVEAQLQYLLKNKVFLLLYVKQSNRYVLFPYTDIPKEHYELTYRGRPDRKNRMWIPAEYLPKFKRVSELEKDLKMYLNTK